MKRIILFRMKRIILLISFYIIALFWFIYWFDLHKVEENQQIIQKKTLQKKREVSPELEEKYELILLKVMRGEDPFSEEKKEKVVEQKQD